MFGTKEYLSTYLYNRHEFYKLESTNLCDLVKWGIILQDIAIQQNKPSEKVQQIFKLLFDYINNNNYKITIENYLDIKCLLYCMRKYILICIKNPSKLIIRELLYYVPYIQTKLNIFLECNLEKF
jgi:Cft2 family RNA processing exonuclease